MSGKSKDERGRATGNPCIGLCRFGGDGACLGCHRTKAEVKGWKRLSDAAKAAINSRIAKGGRQAAEAGPAEGAPPRKRLRKLDRKIGKLEAKLAALRTERDRVTGSGPAG